MNVCAFEGLISVGFFLLKYLKNPPSSVPRRDILRPRAVDYQWGPNPSKHDVSILTLRSQLWGSGQGIREINKCPVFPSRCENGAMRQGRRDALHDASRLVRGFSNSGGVGLPASVCWTGLIAFLLRERSSGPNPWALKQETPYRIGGCDPRLHSCHNLKAYYSLPILRQGPRIAAILCPQSNIPILFLKIKETVRNLPKTPVVSISLTLSSSPTVGIC